MHITPSFSDTNMDVTWQDQLGNVLQFSGRLVRLHKVQDAATSPLRRCIGGADAGR